MFNNIKWKMPWSIHFRQEFGEYGQLKHGDWCVRLVDEYNDQVRDIILEVAPELDFDDFYGLDGQYWIKKLMVMPNEELYIFIENINRTGWFQIEISKCEAAYDVYRIKVVETDRNENSRGKYGLCEVHLLEPKEFEKMMETFEPYMEVFPFSLPLGECFDIDVKSD